jgi:hypothetical protein
MLAMFHITTRAPRIRAHCNIDDIGISAAYIDRIDSLLKHTVAFHSIEKDIIPYNGKKVRNVDSGRANFRLTLKKNVAFSGPKRW